MTNIKSALECALIAWTNPSEGRDEKVADAEVLNEFGVFSVENIIAITGLPRAATYDLLGKSRKTGGRLNPETLSSLFDLKTGYEDGARDKQLVRTIVAAGTSPGMIARLTGIPNRTLTRWASSAS